VEQKLLLCCVDGRAKDVTLSSPETHLIVADVENKFAA
jgi:hypothetical protein